MIPKKPLIVANWKMNPSTLIEAQELFNSVEQKAQKIENAEIIICPPFVYLCQLKAENCKLGAQDCFWEEKGAFTGEISPLMLKGFNCQYVIVGHSERRKHQQENDGAINKKVKEALGAGLRVILCIEKISQLEEDLKEVGGDFLNNLIIAFEPISAIGTGKPFEVEAARQVFLGIREKFREIPVLYGGSVNSGNARDYLEKAGFNGLLVGSASLNAEEFSKIAESCD